MLNVKEILGTVSKFSFLDEDTRDKLEAVAESADENTGKLWSSARLTEAGGVCFSLEADGGIFKMLQTAAMLIDIQATFGGGDDDEEFEFDLDEDQ